MLHNLKVNLDLIQNIFYKIPKNILLGGKYGTKLNVNFRSNSISGGTSFLNDIDSLTHNVSIIQN